MGVQAFKLRFQLLVRQQALQTDVYIGLKYNFLTHLHKVEDEGRDHWENDI